MPDLSRGSLHESGDLSRISLAESTILDVLGPVLSKMKSVDLAKLVNLVGRPISLFTEDRYRSKLADLARAHAGIQ